MSVPVQSSNGSGKVELQWQLAGKQPVFNLSNFDSTDMASNPYQRLAGGGQLSSGLLDALRRFNDDFLAVGVFAQILEDKEEFRNFAQEHDDLIAEIKEIAEFIQKGQDGPELFHKLTQHLASIYAKLSETQSIGNQILKALAGKYLLPEGKMDESMFFPLLLYHTLDKTSWTLLTDLVSGAHKDDLAKYNGIYPHTERFYDGGHFIGDKLTDVKVRGGSAAHGNAHLDLYHAISRLEKTIASTTGPAPARLTSSSNNAKKTIENLQNFLGKTQTYTQNIVAMAPSEIHGTSANKRRKLANVIERDRMWDVDARATIQDRLDFGGLEDESKFEMFIVKLAYYGAAIIRDAFAHALIDEKFVQMFLEKNDFNECTKGGVWRFSLQLSNFKEIIETSLKPLVSSERLEQLKAWLGTKYCGGDYDGDQMSEVTWTYIVSAFSNGCARGAAAAHPQKTIYIQLVSNLATEFVSCIAPLFRIESGTNNRYIMDPYHDMTSQNMQGMLLGGTPYVVRNPQSLINVNTFLGHTAGVPGVPVPMLEQIWDEGLSDREFAFTFWADIFSNVGSAVFNTGFKDYFRRVLLDPKDNTPIIALSWPLLCLFGLVEDPGNSRAFGEQVNVLQQLADYFHPRAKGERPRYMLETYLQDGVSTVVNQPKQPFICGILLDMMFSAVMHRYGTTWPRIQVEGYTNLPTEILVPYFAVRELMSTRTYDSATLDVNVYDVQDMLHECYVIDFTILRYVSGFYDARKDRTTKQLIDQLRARIIRLAYEPQSQDLADAYRNNFVRQFTEPPWGGSYAQMFSQLGTQLASLFSPSIVGSFSKGTALSTSNDRENVPAFLNEVRRRPTYAAPNAFIKEGDRHESDADNIDAESPTPQIEGETSTGRQMNGSGPAAAFLNNGTRNNEDEIAPSLENQSRAELK